MRDDAGAAVSANPRRGGLFLPLGGRLHLTRSEACGKAAGSGHGQDAWDRHLQNAARAAGPGPYAVRSSAAAEDLPGASYAGI